MPIDFLLAQSADLGIPPDTTKTVIQMALALAGFVVVMLVMLPVIITMKNAKQAHAERMKLMEMGYLPPARSSRWPQAFYCATVGLGVPVGTFFLTWLGSQNLRAPIDIWVAPSVVSVAAVLGATVVAGISFFRADVSAQPEKLTPAVGKPSHDGDALDFAGRLNRG